MQFWKITIYIIIVSLFTIGCNKEVYTTVPASPIYYTLVLDSYLARPIQTPGGVIVITKPSIVGQSVGNLGIVIIRAIDKINEYYAFDLRCPYDVEKKVKLNVDNTFLVCPVCHSKYDIVSGGGFPISGPSKFPLRKYRVYQSGRTLIITN